MWKIKTLSDLKTLQSEQNKPNPLPRLLLQHLEDSFNQLYEALSDGELVESFSLEDYGYFVILYPSDNLRDLRELGLNPETNGLLGSWPEYVEKLHLNDGSIWCKIAILYDNDYMMFFFLQPEDYDDEIQQWLENFVNEEWLLLNSK